jgi:hypothetical protein
LAGQKGERNAPSLKPGPPSLFLLCWLMTTLILLPFSHVTYID